VTIAVRHIKSPGRRVVDTAEDGRVHKSGTDILRDGPEKAYENEFLRVNSSCGLGDVHDTNDSW